MQKLQFPPSVHITFNPTKDPKPKNKKDVNKEKISRNIKSPFISRNNQGENPIKAFMIIRNISGSQVRIKNHIIASMIRKRNLFKNRLSLTVIKE